MQNYRYTSVHFSLLCVPAEWPMMCCCFYFISPLGKLAGRAIYFACVNFFLFLMVARRTIISWSSGLIFAIFPLNESVLGADDRTGRLFPISRFCIPSYQHLDTVTVWLQRIAIDYYYSSSTTTATPSCEFIWSGTLSSSEFLIPCISTAESSWLKLKFHRSSFLVASSLHPRRHAWHVRHPRDDATRMSRVSGCRATSRSACHALTWLVSRRSAAVYRPSVARLSVCRVVLQSPRGSRARHARLVADKSLASS